MHEWSWEVTQQVSSNQFTQPWYFTWDAKDLLKVPRTDKNIQFDLRPKPWWPLFQHPLMVSLPAWLSWQPWHDRWRKSLRGGKVSTLLIWALNVPLLEHSLTIDTLWLISSISHLMHVLNCFQETHIDIHMGHVTKVRLSCYLVLQSNDSKTR